jgi:hypothetical protein
MLHRACNRANWYPVGDLRSAIMAGQQRWLERQTDLTSSYARRRPALPEGLEWRVEGLVAAGRTVDVSRAGASWAPNRLDVFVGAATTRFTGDSPTLGCDHLQQRIELQSVICSALLYSLDPVVGGLCMHILWLSLE